jgi:pyruvate dehydrogenase E1 component alpha subunit
VAEINLLNAYRTMVTMRAYELAIAEACETGEVHGEMHLGIGQEAIAAALAALFRPTDAVVSTHRPHLHALALGVDPVEMLAELLERDGLCRGKGGHMHLFDRERRFMCTGIVGAGAPIALGYAFAARREGARGVAVAIAGDGAMNQGALLESLNLAALWRLPVIFLCEDNGYGISVRRDVASAGALVDRGAPFGIPGAACDGADPEAVFHVLEPAFQRARRGEGPSAVVARCYRFRGHYEGDADTYRSREEKEDAAAPGRDPVSRLRARLRSDGVDEARLLAVEQDARTTVDRWLADARARPLPDISTVREDVYA